MDRTIVIAPRSWDTVCWNRTPRIVAICTRTGPYNSIWLDLKHVAETHVSSVKNLHVLILYKA